MVVTLNPEDRRKLDELRRIKFLATATLVFCFGTMIVAKLLGAGYPWLAAVAAAAEAATPTTRRAARLVRPKRADRVMGEGSLFS